MLNSRQFNLFSMSEESWLDPSITNWETEHYDNGMLTNLELRSIGCLLGGAIADAFASQVKPNDNFEKMSKNPIKELSTKSPSGALWNDSTSLSLALSISLIEKGRFESYDQLSRYKRWWRHGYLAPNRRPRSASIQSSFRCKIFSLNKVSNKGRGRIRYQIGLSPFFNHIKANSI